MGATIPNQATIQHTDEMIRTPLTLTVALGADGTSSVYQDAGEGYAYRHGDSRTLQITLHGDELTLAIPAVANFQRIGFVEFLGLQAVPKQATADGKVLSNIRFDAKSKRLHLALPNENAHVITLQR